MNVVPYLLFSGHCADAFAFYERALGGTIVTVMRFGETPPKTTVPAERHDKVLHTRLDVSGEMLLGSDVPPGSYTKPQGMAVSLSIDGVDQARRISMRSPTAAASAWRSNRRSGRRGLAWPPIDSGPRGSSTPTSEVARARPKMM